MRKQPGSLDNVNKKVMKGEERKDLLYIYAVDSDGTMAVTNDDGKKRELAAVRKNTNMRNLNYTGDRMIFVKTTKKIQSPALAVENSICLPE